jgi:hypothetical protein
LVRDVDPDLLDGTPALPLGASNWVPHINTFLRRVNGKGELIEDFDEPGGEDQRRSSNPGIRKFERAPRRRSGARAGAVYLR